MRDYVQRRYGFPGGSISVQGRGEDWDGLRAAVEKSGMPSKREVLAIIDSYDIFDGREKRLMDLQGGEPYKYMLRRCFRPCAVWRCASTTASGRSARPRPGSCSTRVRRI